jgi:hypothetical protein
MKRIKQGILSFFDLLDDSSKRKTVTHEVAVRDSDRPIDRSSGRPTLGRGLAAFLEEDTDTEEPMTRIEHVEVTVDREAMEDMLQELSSDEFVEGFLYVLARIYQDRDGLREGESSILVPKLVERLAGLMESDLLDLSPVSGEQLTQLLQRIERAGGGSTMETLAKRMLKAFPSYVRLFLVDRAAQYVGRRHEKKCLYKYLKYKTKCSRKMDLDARLERGTDNLVFPFL